MLRYQLLNKLNSNKLLEHSLLVALKSEYHFMHLFLIVIIIALFCFLNLAIVPDFNCYSFSTWPWFYHRHTSLRGSSASIHLSQLGIRSVSVCLCCSHIFTHVPVYLLGEEQHIWYFPLLTCLPLFDFKLPNSSNSNNFYTVLYKNKLSYIVLL